MTVSAVRPWRSALRRDACFPGSVFGPVLRSALPRLASIRRYEVMGFLPNWLRFGILARPYRLRAAMHAFSATKREPRHRDRPRAFPPTRLHRHSDAAPAERLGPDARQSRRWRCDEGPVTAQTADGEHRQGGGRRPDTAAWQLISRDRDRECDVAPVTPAHFYR